MEETAEQIESAIAALEAQRALLGDAVVAMAVAPLQEKLAARRERDSATQQLKTATVLFMDVVGSTRLSERLDPEDVHAVMDSALARLTAIVRAHEGRVLQYAGDSLLAAFGADQALEDDAERAVRAGLAIVAEAEPLAAEFRATLRARRLRPCASASTPARCCSAAASTPTAASAASPSTSPRAWSRRRPAGALRISHETYRHVRGVFDVEAQAPIEIKGITEPVAQLPRHARQAARLPHGQPRPRGHRDADGRPRRRAGAHRRRVPRARARNKSLRAGDDRRRARHRQEPPRPRVHALARAAGASRCASSRAGRSRTATTFRTACCATCSPGASRSSRATRSRSRRPSSPPGSAPCSASAPAEYTALIGELIGFDFGADPHIAAIASEAKQIRDRAFHALAVVLPRPASRHRRRRSSSCSTTCTGPTRARSTSSITWRSSAATCRCSCSA